jgi:hypothetical protein
MRARGKENRSASSSCRQAAGSWADDFLKRRRPQFLLTEITKGVVSIPIEFLRY